MEYRIEGDNLVITLPVGASAFTSARLSSTLQSFLVCSDAIRVDLPHGRLKVMVNATTPNPDAPPKERR